MKHTNTHPICQLLNTFRVIFFYFSFFSDFFFKKKGSEGMSGFTEK